MENLMVFFIMFQKCIPTKIICEVTDNRVNMIAVILRIIIFYYDSGAFYPVISFMSWSVFFTACPCKYHLFHTCRFNILHHLLGEQMGVTVNVKTEQF